MAPRKHQQLLTAAIEREGDGQRELMAGQFDVARVAFREAADMYRQSWDAAPPRSYGRLVGMLKCAVLAGGGVPEAKYARSALNDDPARGSAARVGSEGPPESAESEERAGSAESEERAGSESPTASYAHALAALILDLDAEALAWALAMSTGNDAFKRTGEGIAALASHDGGRYAGALAAIVHDFEQRTAHLTGVAIADTAVVLAALAARRGIAVAIDSLVLPPLPMPQDGSSAI